MAVNIETKTPTASASANPLIRLVVKKYNTKQVISVEMFESRMEGQALLNPSLMARSNFFPARNSSFILANIKILASTAMPMDRMNPAIPGKVRVIGQGEKKDNLKIAIIMPV